MRPYLCSFALIAALVFAVPLWAQNAVWPAKTHYKTIDVDGHKIFYREAGNSKNPTILLLHGYPASSHSYRELIPLLSGRFHVIAPDNLGSGYSDKPDPEGTVYTFDLLADVMAGFTDALGLKQYTLYMQDFGAPVGYRLIMKQPERLQALIVQNANAYLEGLTTPRRAFFKSAHEDRSPEKWRQLYNITGLQGVRDKQYLRDVQDRQTIMSPDSWTHDLHFLETGQQRKIQVQLFQDYQNNIDAYPDWQAFLRKQKPPTLIVWGKNDPAFIYAGAEAYLQDLPDAQLYLLDAGHFAVEEKPVDIARHIIRFMGED
ncbi:alpha/beta fold hydrolase [Microbulbifer discodermiae]|uniref:alpha/beta fold hydrolase n=1 Tax=Microbulbifer sp. 2201CG32-9 TaxID=3232309 RepID=UPI00345BEFC7